MAFVHTVPVHQAEGDVRAMYERTQAAVGYVPNYAKVFSHRPQVMAAWSGLLASIRANLDARRYELVTLAAARALRSSYCMLAHGSILRKQFYSAEQLTAIAGTASAGELATADVAMMAFAEQVARDASAITESACGPSASTASRTPRSLTSLRPPRRAASSASCWMRSGRSPTRRTRAWRTS